MAPELKLEGVTFRVWRGAELRAYGEAREASLRRDSTRLEARELVSHLPGRGGLPVRIAAPAGEGVLQDRTFAAHGGVTLSRGSDVARTERARFEPGPAGGAVRGEDPLTVEGPRYRLRGTGFLLDPATGDLDVRGPARLDALAPEAR